MANERKTEILVRDGLINSLGYSSEEIEPQKSENKRISKLLNNASKSGKGGIGRPEFIITKPENTDFVMIIECKPDIKQLASKLLDNPINYAVDGALHYAKALSAEFNVIAIGITGETETSLKVRTYLHPKLAEQAKELKTKDGKNIHTLLPWHDYIEHATFDPRIQRLRYDELMAYSKELHDFMRDHAKLSESEKPLLVSGTLIALRNEWFAENYQTQKPKYLPEKWFEAIQNELSIADIPTQKRERMFQPYSGIAAHPELDKPSKQFSKGILFELVDSLNKKIMPFMKDYNDFDVVGQFYGEFLKYTGGDKSALGIVLTPRHITELFSLIANVNKNSKVLDICTGTGGFLISAMHHMMKDALTKQEKENIKRHGLIGVEQQPHMYALAASNMILRGDGKANLYQGSCFDTDITKAIQDKKCNIGMINPPYSQKDKALHEFNFINHMLNCLQPGNIGIAIVPMQLAIGKHELKSTILQNHTLKAVMSMPEDVFYPVGVVSCIMVFEAKIPHATANKKTWFGYWKNDGFIKAKNKGRIDLNNNWAQIRDNWIKTYRNNEVIDGESILQSITAEDEWCAEAYTEADFQKLKEEHFIANIKSFAIHQFKTDAVNSISIEPFSKNASLTLDTKKWGKFTCSEIFNINLGRPVHKKDLADGHIPYVSRTACNNGLDGCGDSDKINKGNAITIGAEGVSAFYQPSDFITGNKINIIRHKQLNKYNAMFLITVLNHKNIGRFNYGYAIVKGRLEKLTINLPITPDGHIDWEWMTTYIQNLNYSKTI